MTSKLLKFGINKPETESPTAKPGSGLTLHANKVELTDATFNELRTVIYNLCGIYYTDSKKYLLESRIAKRLEINKLESFEQYIDFIQRASNRIELESLFEVITINETYFFRAPHQFEALEDILIPEIIEQKKKIGNNTFKLWSAASSTGEEAYSLSLMLEERWRRKYPGINFQIYASDINNAVIENAKKGIFKQYAVRNIPPDMLNRYFKEQSGLYALDDRVKRNVKFMNINLYDNYQMRMMTGFDIIFCANVLIYFDLDAKQTVVSQLYNALNNNSYLFIGYSESLHGVSKAFKLIHLPKAMVYKKE
jgi:chemotaxis protein methyltransferase CheR